MSVLRSNATGIGLPWHACHAKASRKVAGISEVDVVSRASAQECPSRGGEAARDPSYQPRLGTSTG